MFQAGLIRRPRRYVAAVRTRIVLLAAAVGLVAAACSSGDTAPAPAPLQREGSGAQGDGAEDGLPDDAIVIRASTDLAVGSERLLLALSDEGGARLGSPDLDVTFTLYPEDDLSMRQAVEGSWIWAIPEVSGLYRANVEFDRPGVWFAEVTAGGTLLAPVPFTVNEVPATPAVGAPAPPSVTPTAADVEDLAAITTDGRPDPDFYELSISEAVTSGRTSVVVFATPKFCQTAICGPTLEAIKDVKADFPDVNFVHVEVYDLAASGDATQVEDLVVHPAIIEWGLTSEPWIFVVDSSGNVSGRFEGLVAREELESLLS